MRVLSRPLKPGRGKTTALTRFAGIDIGLAVTSVVTFVAWLKLRHMTHDIKEHIIHLHDAEHDTMLRRDAVR
jgi:hypothetical protein